MKKIIALFLVFVFVFGLVSCNVNGEGEESSTPVSEGADEPSESKKHDRRDLPYVYPMSDAMKYLIEKELATDGDALVWFDSDADVLDNEAVRYYGMFGDGYCILFQHVGWDIEFDCYQEVAGEGFTHSEMFEIYAYKNESLITLESAYENGYLELGEIMIIADIHADFEDYIATYNK
jgi:hypothetical protein